MSGTPRRIVVDVSVATAAGADPSPSSRRARGFLDGLLAAGHTIVVTDEITAEWARHGPGFPQRWLASMHDRGRVVRVVPRPGLLGNQVRTADDWTFGEAAALEKGLPLVFAAVATDRVIASCDATTSALFARCARYVAPVASVTWIDPAADDDHSAAWLMSR